MADHNPGDQWRGADNFEERHFERVGTYRGQITPGKGFHGLGSFVYDSGDVYEGQVGYPFSGTLVGPHTTRVGDRGVTDGTEPWQWLCNQRHGVGRCVYADGKTYEGDWEFDMMQGKGKLQDADSMNVYDGSFLENLKHGEGVQVTEDGHRYDGQWARGKMCGRGKMLYRDGSSYDGEWAAGKQEGVGEMKHVTGGWTYSGGWHRGKRHGKGVLRFVNGDRYEGDMKADMIEGEGTMSFAVIAPMALLRFACTVIFSALLSTI